VPPIRRLPLAARFPGRGGFFVRFRAALPLGVLAPAVLRRPPALLALALRPAPARFAEGVRRALRAFREEVALLARFRVFFAMVVISLFSGLF
jgi:hypothetical protein